MFYGKLIEEVKQLKERVEELYVYGAGLRGREICRILTRNGIEVNGFLTTRQGKNSMVLGLPVKIAKDMMFANVGIIIGLGDIYTEEVVEYLKENGVDFNRVVDGGKYITQDRKSKDLQNNPTIEITTVLGCSVNCKYCPQNVLMNAYYKENRNRKKQMSTGDFKMLLRNTPDNCDIMFAGMAEPYLNPDCTEMLKLACEAGRNVSLYTTLEGTTEKDIDAMLGLPLQFVELHVADERKYAHITETEQYYKNVERLINAKKMNGEPFVNDVGAQAVPTSKILELCRGKYEVLTSVQDRAGNLEGEELVTRDRELTDEQITCCFCGPAFNNHVVLPDGTLLLCNMDYGMKHIIGNLLENTFDEIRAGEKMKAILEEVNGRQSMELLCRKCIFAMIKK